MSEIVEHRGTDVLADVLDSLKLRGRFFCRCELSAPWALGFAARVFAHFHVIENGTCCLQLQGEADAVALEEGDLLLVIPRGHGYQLSDQRHGAAFCPGKLENPAWAPKQSPPG
jgi:hypothetical protein